MTDPEQILDCPYEEFKTNTVLQPEIHFETKYVKNRFYELNWQNPTLSRTDFFKYYLDINIENNQPKQNITWKDYHIIDIISLQLKNNYEISERFLNFQYEMQLSEKEINYTTGTTGLFNFENNDWNYIQSIVKIARIEKDNKFWVVILAYEDSFNISFRYCDYYTYEQKIIEKFAAISSSTNFGPSDISLQPFKNTSTPLNNNSTSLNLAVPDDNTTFIVIGIIIALTIPGLLFRQKLGLNKIFEASVEFLLGGIEKLLVSKKIQTFFQFLQKNKIGGFLITLAGFLSYIFYDTRKIGKFIGTISFIYTIARAIQFSREKNISPKEIYEESYMKLLSENYVTKCRNISEFYNIPINE